MTTYPQLDPISAAKSLLGHITGNDDSGADLKELAARIDAFMYSLRFLQTDSVPAIRQTDAEPPETTDQFWRDLIGPGFPMLGFYWCALSSRIKPGKNAEVTVNDAIDDLTDIAREFAGVDWYLEKHGRNEAMPSLRWCYESHLWMHLIPLRAHLENEIFGNW